MSCWLAGGRSDMKHVPTLRIADLRVNQGYSRDEGIFPFHGLTQTEDVDEEDVLLPARSNRNTWMGFAGQ